MTWHLVQRFLAIIVELSQLKNPNFGGGGFSMRSAGILLSLCALTTGCASFEGMPRSVMSSNEAIGFAKKFVPDLVIQEMHGLGEDERTVYRNRVIAAYLLALDARYDDFLRSLSKSSKGSEVIFDTAILGLTGVASVVSSASTELAAGATALGGTRASLNKQLFAEKTLPIIIGMMDARRLQVRAEIMRHSSESESVYTVQEAFSDLWRYQSVATIDGAIQQASAAAAAQQARAKYDYSKAIELCTSDDAAVRQDKRALLIAVEDLLDPAGSSDAAIADPARQKLRAAAIAAGRADTPLATDSDSADKQRLLVRDRLDQICDSATLNALKAKLQMAGVM